MLTREKTIKSDKNDQNPVQQVVPGTANLAPRTMQING